jgi:serine/threonine-protein kinase
VAADYRNIRFSPDGRRLAIVIRQGAQQDVWVYEWERDTLSRLTFDASYDGFPVWTPNGQRIAFRSTRADKATTNLYWQRADGTGEAERLTESPNGQTPESWHPSGKFLAFYETHPQTQSDIMILPLEGDEVSGWKPGKPSVFLNTPFREDAPAFSPDGRWFAYRSTSRGRTRSTCARSRARAGNGRSRPVRDSLPPGLETARNYSTGREGSSG